MTPRVLVVGADPTGFRHARNAAELGAVELYVHDPDTQLGERVQRAGLLHFETLPFALESRPDAVIVSGRDEARVETALAALQAGAHVYLESPGSATVEQVIALFEQAAQRDRVLMLGHALRFHPALLHLLDRARAGDLGDLVALHATHAFASTHEPSRDEPAPESPCLPLGDGLSSVVAELDAILLLMPDVERVFASTSRSGLLPVDDDDCALVTLISASGITATLRVDALGRPPARSLEFVGTAASLRWESHRGLSLYDVASRATTSTPLDVEVADAQRDALGHFFACLRGNQQPPVTATEARRVYEILGAARASAASGAVIFV